MDRISIYDSRKSRWEVSILGEINAAITGAVLADVIWFQPSGLYFTYI